MIEISNGRRNITHLLNKYSGRISLYETGVLLAYLSGLTRGDIYTKDALVNEGIEEAFGSLVKRRMAGEPLQYITGQADFMGMDFFVNKAVFIPRPETEILVEKILPAMHYMLSANHCPGVLDLCTGCGNIAVTLAKAIPKAKITAADISPDALETARKNAIRHNAARRIRFYRGNLFKALIFDKIPKFDIIVCNPPYVKTEEVNALQREVRHEPRIALDGGRDGLDFYRRLAETAPDYLEKNGRLILEIGFGQAQEVINIFSAKRIFNTDKAGIQKDISGIDRVIWISLS